MSFFFESGSEAGGMLNIAVKAFLINILNPKLTIFFLTFLPLFVSSGSRSPVLQLSVLSGVFMVMTLVIFIIYGFLANGVRGYIIGSPKTIQYMKKSFAVVIGYFGAKLALTEK